MSLLAFGVFPYLWNEETGKGIYNGLRKLNIIFILPDFHYLI